MRIEDTPLLRSPRVVILSGGRATKKIKMSSYGAIGLDNDLDPLLIAESMPRSQSYNQLRSAQAPNGQRQPYMFTGGLGLSREGSNLSLQSEEDFHRDHNMALRYRLYSRLDPGGQQLRMPDHVTPSEFFSILPFEELKDSSGKQSSIITIFSIWNTMMGSSLLAMPWAIQQAGLVWGIALMLGLGLLCFYTAYLVMKSPHGMSESGIDPLLAEFTDVCRVLWGRAGETTATVFSVVVLLGGVIVYWVLMSNFMYHTGVVVYEALQPNSSTIPIMENKTFTCDVYCPEVQLESFTSVIDSDMAVFSGNSTWRWDFDHLWSLQRTVPVYLALLTFPLMNFKSPTFFTKFNVLGTISVMFLLVFTGSKLCECGFNMNFTDVSSIHFVKLFNWRFPALTGTLTLSYFIHNVVLTILRNQKHPEKNARDLSIAYFLVAFCYVFIGFTFFAGFPVNRDCISDNFLNNFGTGDILSSVARMFLLFQMFTVLPLLMFLIRSQVCYFTMGKTWPGFSMVIVLNIVIIALAILIAMFYPKVGGILRYVGSFSGLMYVFALPALVYMKKEDMNGRLTTAKKVFHFAIVVIGCMNLIAQFLI